MKKLVLAFTFFFITVSCMLQPVAAQEQPKPQKDTVNMDTNAKPEKYYAVEDEKTETKDTKGGSGIIIIVAAAVVVAGAAAFFLLKKKK